MLQFVPMTDDLLYRSEDLPGPLVPYRCGVPVWHEPSVAKNTATAQPTPLAAEEPVNA